MHQYLIYAACTAGVLILVGLFCWFIYSCKVVADSLSDIEYKDWMKPADAPTHFKWISSTDQRVRRSHMTSGVMSNSQESLRKTLLHDGNIEQYIEEIPRKWWQFKARTRIRIRRIKQSFLSLNCRCAMVEIK